MLSLGHVKTLITIARNVCVAGLIYLCIFSTLHVIRGGSVKYAAQSLAAEDQQLPDISEQDVKVVGKSSAGLKIKFAGSDSAVTINPYANVFNRPESAAAINDSYLGLRPHIDTEVYFPKLLENCRGTYEKAERMPRVAQCLYYLHKQQGDYSRLPLFNQRASQQDPRLSEFADSDARGNTASRYRRGSELQGPNILSTGTCAGPVIPYHVYWNAPISWRLELFIKSYFYTQNIACSRLHVWLDGVHAPLLLNRTETNGTAFDRFYPLVERGDLILERWMPPKRFRLSDYEATNIDEVELSKKFKNPDGPDEIDEGNGISIDRFGQQWLTLNAKQISRLPAMAIDFVRLATLHKYGGVFLNTDVLLLRDLRPLLLPFNQSFAIRQGARVPNGEYNPAVLSLRANSSLSSYLLRGGVRMGMNFHSLVLGTMALKDGRNTDLTILENSLFDPLWPGNKIQGPCPVPCLGSDSSLVFQGHPDAIEGEWQGFGAKLYKVKAPKKAGSPGSTPNGVPARPEAEYAEAADSQKEVESTWTAVKFEFENLGRFLSPKQYALKDYDFDFDLHEKVKSLPGELPLAPPPHDEAPQHRRKRSAPHTHNRLPMAADAPDPGYEVFAEPPARAHSITLLDDVDVAAQPEDDTMLMYPNGRPIAALQIEDAFSPSKSALTHLRELGIVEEYDAAQDRFPPTNRTLQHFFRGAYAYTVHGEWHRHPAPNSWIDVLQRAHDAFFAGKRANAYGERWYGPAVDAYNRWPEYL